MEPLSSRRSIRYNGYDYGRAGYYALTVCTAGKAHLFGCIENSQLIPSSLGLIVQEELLLLPVQHATVALDEWVVMPNHLHFILILRKNHVISVAQLVGAFKSQCFHDWRVQQLALGRKAPASCWQRNYYEHIIRNPDELAGYRNYIRENPSRWRNK